MAIPTPISSTPTPTPTQPVPVPKYGDTVVDSQGRTGTAAFDPNTGKALTPPAPTAPVLRYTGSPSSNTPASVAPQDDAALRTQEMQNVQGQIDRINSDFATNLTQTTQNNANLIGSTRAIAARTGNLGSDFGNTNIENAGTKAQANLTKIQEQHTNELQKIYDGVNKDIATKQTAYQTQQNKLSDEQTKNFRDNAFKTVDGLAAKGTSLDTLTQDEYNHLVQSTGMSDGQLRAYYAGKVPADKVLKEQISNGNLIQVTRDPTGQVSVHNLPLGINIPTTYTTTHLPSGQIAFVPKGTAPTGGIVYSSKIKPGDNLDNKMIVYDGPGANKPIKAGKGGVKPISGAPKGVTQDDIDTGTENLHNAKGADGYVDPYFYKSMYDHWTSQGGSPSSFQTHYPAKNYVNPTDSKLLPSYLRPPTPKGATKGGTGA